MRSLETSQPNSKLPVRGKWFFLGSFIFACFLFWWVPSLLFRTVVHQTDEIENTTIVISILAMICFIAGYLFPAFGRRPTQYSEPVLAACGNLSYRAAVLLAIPALILAIQFWRTHQSMTYGYMAIVPIPSNIRLCFTLTYFSASCTWDRPILGGMDGGAF